MMALEELTLTYEYTRARFQSGNGDGLGTAIIECRQPDNPAVIVVKLECSQADFVSGLAYRFYGRWVTHYKHGRQFAARTFVRVQPHGRAGTIRYLMQAPGVGQVIATQLWGKFEGDAVRIAREQPEVAAAASGLSASKAAVVAQFLEEAKRLEDVTIDLMDLLIGRGFPKQTGKKCVEEWGNRAAELIRRNPYLLMRFRGCGFLQTDQLYMSLGGNPAKLKRQALCSWYAIARQTTGDTWFQPAVIEKTLAEMIAGAEVRPIKAMRLAKRGKLLATRKTEEPRQTWFAEARKAANESRVAERVREWLGGEQAVWPGVEQLDASNHQKETAARALTAPLAIVTGGPGTGKTYLAARLIGGIQQVGAGPIAVAAPTGKAAVRIGELMQGYGLNLRARTIHSLLGVESRTYGDGWGFRHNGENPLPYRWVVVDEASMIDTDLAASLFRACAPGTHVLLVGDTGQLPPVGHGAPLRDMMAAGVPYGELTEIRRNSGRIVETCHEIRKGKFFWVSAKLKPSEGENLKLLPAANGGRAVEQIVKTLKEIGRRRIANPIWECQVICAVNKRSDLSRKELNRRLQRELNPRGERVEGNPFRVGDKIVCLKNGFYPVVEDAPSEFNTETTDQKVFVANGEQAAVKHLQPRLTIAQLSAPARLIKIPRGAGKEEDEGKGGKGGGDEDDKPDTGCQWDLAYAVSCHKAQGSEWPIVFVCLDEYPGARLVCSREWLYTGISRAKKVCFLVGKLGVAHGMIGREAIKKRKTFLGELIEG